MRVAIFGASGATGQLLTEHSLTAGHQVTVLLRSPESFPFRTRVHIIQGNAFDPVAVANTLSGADVVLSALGARSLKKEDVLERAVPLIVTAMNQAGIRRIIALGSAGALPSSLDKQPAWRRWIVQNLVYNTFLKYPVASQISQYKTLSTSGLDWTMVMPPMLTNGPAKGHYRIDGEALPRNGSRISRADVADFMMQQLTSDEWKQKGVYLSL
ncbi:MAG: SDR family oxidoreductase [Granulicella sp.]